MSVAVRVAAHAELGGLCDLASTVVESLDVHALEPDGAAVVYGQLCEVGRLVDAAKTLVAARAAESARWKTMSLRSPAHWLARMEGSGVAAAERRVETSSRVAALDATRKALVAGGLSTAQVELVARAAAADPTAEDDLLASAAVDSLKGLRTKALNVEAAADAHPEQTRRKARTERFCRFTTPQPGRGRITAEGPLDEMVDVWTDIEPYQEAIFTRGYKDGGRESFDAYTYDAFLALVAAARGDEPGIDVPAADARRPKFILVGSLDAFLRGHQHPGETVEIPGIGPYPLDAALAQLPEAILRLVITTGTDAYSVVTNSRHIAEAVRVALRVRDGECVEDGCNETRFLEIDHTATPNGYRDTRITRLADLCYRCKKHHRDRTNRTGKYTKRLREPPTRR
jgi:hypothetical protein